MGSGKLVGLYGCFVDVWALEIEVNISYNYNAQLCWIGTKFYIYIYSRF